MDAARQRRVRELARWLSVRAEVIRLMKRALANACEAVPDEADETVRVVEIIDARSRN
jgi:hypothetical protein